MARFLEDIKPFQGEGGTNAAGETLEEFLDHYDPGKYETPSCTTDAVVFSCKASGKTGCARQEWAARQILMDELKLLMVKRKNHPSIGCWALPGGFAEMKENLSETAKRELVEETGVKEAVMEPFAVYGNWDRDPRTRVITTAYLALVEEDEVQVEAGDDAADACWCEARMWKTDEYRENGWYVRRFRLHIYNGEKGFRTEAEVEERSLKGLIRAKEYRVISPGKTAVDHAAIIVQALEILKERAEEVLNR